MSIASALFEQAADLVITGQGAPLQQLLGAHADLVRAQSVRPHRATLLHYLAANGVENERQRSPQNAPEIARLLLENDASVDALANTYQGGSQQTTLNLLVSSAHPHRSGVQVPLVHVLADFGAALDGLANDHSPLATALDFHYPAAAEALAARGAVISSAAYAAGLNRLDLLADFFRAAPLSNSELAQGLLWAAMHNRIEALDFLLAHNAPINAQDRRGFTPLHWAALYGHIEGVRCLLKAKASLEIQNEYGGTPRGQVLWSMQNEEPHPNHPAVLALLSA